MTTVKKGTGAARKAKLYLSKAFKVPSWVEIVRVKGHKLTLGKKTGQVTGRDMVAEINLPGGLTVGPLTFEYRHLKGGTDAVFDDLWDSYANDTELLWLETDAPQDATGVKGISFPGFVSKIDKSAEDANAITYSVEVVYSETYDEDGDLVTLAAYPEAAPSSGGG